MLSVSIYDYDFVRKTYLGNLKSFYIKEKRSTYGDYTVWIENDQEVNQYLKEGNFIEFKRGNEASKDRNFIISGENKFGVEKLGNEFRTLNKMKAYPLSSMSTSLLNGSDIVISYDYESLTDVEISPDAKIWLQLQYNEEGEEKTLEAKSESFILSAPNGHVEATIKLSHDRLELKQVNVLISGINGTVNIFNAQLEIGNESSRYKNALENDFSYIGKDVSVGIIEKVEYKDEDNFTGLIISGKLCERVTEDRCLYGLFLMNGTPISICNQMIYENFINPDDDDRKYEILQIASQVEEDNEEKITFQKTGFQISDHITNILLSRNLGMKVLFDKYLKKLYYYMYKGKDRSRLQQENPHVIFSDSNGLLINPKYLEDYSNHKNVARIAGRGQGDERIFRTVGTEKGRRRKELYVDARDLSKELANGELMPDEEYFEVLDQRVGEKLAVLQPITSFESSISLDEKAYKYGEDFLIGDKVTLLHTTTGKELDAVVEEVHFIGTSEGDEMSIIFGYSPPSISTLIRSRIT